MNLILFGPPGSGKGTQATYLVTRYTLEHISTGEALRRAIADQTEVGLRVKELMARGSLVSDELVSQVLRTWLQDKVKQTRRFLFDGYPRTVEQVRLMEDIFEEFQLADPLVINLDISEETLLLRLTGRRLCSECGKMFNVYLNQSREPGRCDGCNGVLSQREDDTPEIVQDRMAIYKKQSAPVLECFKEKGNLHTVDATGDATEVFSRIAGIIDTILHDSVT